MVRVALRENRTADQRREMAEKKAVKGGKEQKPKRNGEAQHPTYCSSW